MWCGVMVAMAVLGSVLLARATLYTLMGSLVTVNNATSNTVSVAVGTFTLPYGTVYIQNGGLTATNALQVNIQASMDNTNFVTVATYWPSRTNATTETFVPSYGVQTIYLRGQVITTNSVQVGGTYSQ
jgi:hypothetical protein